MQKLLVTWLQLSDAERETDLEIKSESAGKVQTPGGLSLLLTDNRMEKTAADSHNQKLEDSCKKVQDLGVDFHSMKLKVEQQLEEFDECEDDCERLQTPKSKSKSVLEMLKEELIQASTNMCQTREEQSLLAENSDLYHVGDAQSKGLEIGESSHSTRMKSTQQMQKQKLLVDWLELSQIIRELDLEFERTSARIVPTPCLFSLVLKKNRIAAKENQNLKDKCKELQRRRCQILCATLKVELQLEELDECENNCKRKQTSKSMFVMIKDLLCQSFLDDNSDLYQSSDTQSTGAEIGESSHLMSLSSTKQVEVLPDSLDGPKEQKGRENGRCEDGTLSLTNLKTSRATGSEIRKSSHSVSVKSTKTLLEILLDDWEVLSKTTAELRLAYETTAARMFSTAPCKHSKEFLLSELQNLHPFICSAMMLQQFVEDRLNQLEDYEQSISSWRIVAATKTARWKELLNDL